MCESRRVSEASEEGLYSGQGLCLPSGARRKSSERSENQVFPERSEKKLPDERSENRARAERE